MLQRDIADNKAIGNYGALEILKNVNEDSLVRILTHCNTGSLATAGYGTALGVIRSLQARNVLGEFIFIRKGTSSLKSKYFRLEENIQEILSFPEHVYCTETRPYNQGARLTAYELVNDKIPGTLICDNMVAALMKSRNITAVVVGADRVAANGDTANKIGTYQVHLSFGLFIRCC